MADNILPPAALSESAQRPADAQPPPETEAAKAPAPVEKRPAEAVEDAPAEQQESPSKKAKKDGPADTPAVKETPPAEDLKSLNARQYLEKTVVPLLMQGLQQLVKERPSDPYTALSDYLRDNHPKKKQQQQQQQQVNTT